MENKTVNKNIPFLTLAEAAKEESFYQQLEEDYSRTHKIPMSLEEIIEKYGELLTEQEIEKLKNHGR